MQDLPALETPWSNPILVRSLAKASSRSVSLVPDKVVRKELADFLEILSIKKLTFTGEFSPLGKYDWQFRGTLGASIEQACIVTLRPVFTRIDEDVSRTFLANFDEPEDGSEIEMHADENIEPLGETVDPGLIMAEALALALPAYPRLEHATSGEMIYTEAGKQAMTDDDARPFAGLAQLRDKLEKGTE